MNDATPTLLRQLDALAPGVPPVDTLLEEGRAARRRRRRTAVVGSVAATAVIAVGAGVVVRVVGPVDDTTGPDVTATEELDVPPGTRLVGLGRVAVAVPDDWEANAASCNTPFRDTYWFPYPQDCQSINRRQVSSVAISTVQNAESTPRLPDIQDDGTVDGHEVLGSGPICAPGNGEPCFEVFGVPDLDVWFTVRVPQTDAAAGTMEAIRDSLTVLPDGYTTVPFVPYRDVDQVAFAVRDAGLVPEVEHVECPDTGYCANGVSDVTPAVGTAVSSGSVVTVTVIGGD